MKKRSINKGCRTAIKGCSIGCALLVLPVLLPFVLAIINYNVDEVCWDETGRTRLHFPHIFETDLKEVREELQSNPKLRQCVNKRDVGGETPLVRMLIIYEEDSTEINQIKYIQILLEYGASLEMRCGEDDLTPLHYATKRGYTIPVEELLKHGAEVDVLDARGRTPLAFMLATWGTPISSHWGNAEPNYDGYPAVIQCLLEHGADMYRKDAQGMSAWDYAVKNGHEDLLPKTDDSSPPPPGPKMNQPIDDDLCPLADSVQR